MSFSDADLRALQPQDKKYRVAAGDALFVDIYPGGGRYFVWRYRFPPGRQGRLIDYQIGTYGKAPGQWTLKQARVERARLEVLRRQGEDPRALKVEQRQRIQRRAAVTFNLVAVEWLASVESKLASSTLEDYNNKLRNQILPVFGTRSISDITRTECLDFKRTIEARGARNQSDKVFGVLRSIFGFAIDHEWISEPNPARSSRHANSGHVSQSHPFLRLEEIPDFLSALNQNTGNGDLISIAAVKILLLTFMRVGAIVPGEWTEIDWEHSLWTIPARRMKGKKSSQQDHLIPLSPTLVDVLQSLHRVTGHSTYIFESPRARSTEHIALETPNHLIKRMGYGGKMVAHGVRHMAMTYGQDELKIPYNVIDLQMGHKPPGKVRQAYDKAQYLEERTELMNRWADFLIDKGLIA